MSTSERAASELTAAGLPDPAILERLANEYFRDGTIAPEVDRLVLPRMNSIPDVPLSTQVPDADLAALPANVSALKVPATGEIPRSPGVSGASIPPVPGISRGFPADDISTEAAFSFLRDARGIFDAAPMQAGSIPGMKEFPATEELERFSSVIPGTDISKIPYSEFDPSGQISQSVTLGRQFERPVSFNFLEQANPLERFDVAPVFSPITPNLGAVEFPAGFSDPFDVNTVRRDFPILQEQVNGRQLVWLDNAATTHKPQSVIDRLSYFYQHENSNIHRAAHTLAARATDAYEAAREKVRRFLNASSTNEIIFVRGATEAINLVAQSWGKRHIQKDDEIVITWLEHHANIVPWQMLCAEKGAKLRVAPVDDSGQVLLEEYQKLLNSKTRLVAFAHVSNALGTILPVREMVEMAHRYGAKVLVDGAQAVSHLRVDVQAYDCDFYVFSGHKVFAPTGIGVVYGKSDVLNASPPWQGGGNMITDVTFEKTTYQTPPGRFEAGTGSIGDAVGLGAAIDYLDRIGMANITRHEHELLTYATEAMKRIPGLRLIGTAREKASVLSFVLDGFRTEDVGAALNQEGIAVRSGHHCAQPILRRFGLESTVRPSLAVYNTCDDVDKLIAAIWNLKSGRGAGLS